MKYNWRVSELKKIKERALQIKDQATAYDMNSMINLMNSSMDPDDFNIVAEQNHFNFKESFTNFSLHMDAFPENVYDYLMEFFKIEDDNYEWFMEQPPITPFYISHKKLIELGYECLEQLHDKELLNIYEKITKRKNHQLYMSGKDNPSGIVACLDGATFFNSITRKPYLYVYRTNTACDLQSLVHEALHAHFYDLNKDARNFITYFRELEGWLGNFMAIDFLRKKGYEEVARQLELVDLKSELFDSYRLYLSDLLFGLQKNNKFDLKRVKQCYEQETHDKWKYNKDSLDEFYSIYGFDVSIDLLNYLMVLDTYAKTDNFEDVYHKILEMKSSDDFDTVMNLEDFGYTFMDDGFKDANNLRLALKKEGY
jgi:hypothetical protein